VTKITLDDIKNLREIIKRYRNAYKNWFTVLLELATEGKAKAITKTGKKIEGDREIVGLIAFLSTLQCCKLVDLSDDLSSITIEVNKNKAKIYGWRYIHFMDINDYQILSVKDRSILDIGGFIGDSAIYFNLRGAKRIVSVEASPWAFQMAKKNVEINEFNSISLINCAIDKEGNKKLRLSMQVTNDGFEAKASDCSGDIEIPTCTLDYLIEKYGPFDVLKMDCEGCEYDSIPYSKRLKDFKEILIEYHNGYEILEKKLKEDGFNVQYSRAAMSGKFYNKPLDTKYGLIYAIK
jgi:FkbM family methyltransferase